MNELPLDVHRESEVTICEKADDISHKMTAITVHSVGLKLHEKENFMPGKGDAKEMPEGFAPSEYDVLVGWARQNFHHAGNRRFRTLISENVPSYLKADSKISRGHIITDIVREMQAKSPSGTGFLKLNPYTARWSFIGTDKAKDKVGHALRKALMNAQEGSADGGSSKDDDNQKRDESSSRSPKRKAAAPAAGSSPSSPKPRRKAAAPPVSILKRGDKAAISSRTVRYPAPEALTVDTIASATTGANETDLTSLSKLFASPASGMRPSESNYVMGLSPVARDMFDDKNQEVSSASDSSSPRGGQEQQRRRRSSRSRTRKDHSPSSVPLPPNLDDEGDRQKHMSDGDSPSYPEQRAIPHHQQHGLPPTFSPGGIHSPHFPPHHQPPMYGALPPGAPYFYPPSASEQPHLLPPYPPHLGGGQPSQAPYMLSPRRAGAGNRNQDPSTSSSSNAAALPPVFHQNTSGQHMAPSGIGGPPGHPPPPPPGMYYPPGYYYYPGYMPLPPPPPGHPGAPPGLLAPGGAPNTAPQHPSAFFPGPAGPPGMIAEPYHRSHDEEERVESCTPPPASSPGGIPTP